LRLRDEEGLNFAIPVEWVDALPATGGPVGMDLTTTFRDEDPAKWLSVGFHLSIEGESARALRAYQRAAKLRPDLPEAWTRIGDLELKHKRWSAALDAFAQATVANPGDASALIGRGTAEAMLGLRRKAERTFAEVTRLHSRSKLAWVFLGEAWERIGDPDRALDAYRNARQIPDDKNVIGRFPDDADIAVLTAGLYQRTGRNSEAAAAFEEATRLDPNKRDGWLGLARSAVRRGEYARAIPAYKKALDLFEEDAPTWVDLGVATAQGGDSAAAIRAFRKAIQLDGANAEAWFFLGLELAGLGHYDEAVAALRQLRELDPRRAAELERLLSRRR